jgi:hypothetical protein
MLRRWAIHPVYFQAFTYNFGYIWGRPNGPKMAKNSIKNCFLVVLDHFSHKNGPDDLVRGLFSCLDIRSYIPPTFGPLSTFLGTNGPKMVKKQDKNLFCGCFRPLEKKNGPNDLRAYFLVYILSYTSSPLVSLWVPFFSPFGGA